MKANDDDDDDYTHMWHMPIAACVVTIVEVEPEPNRTEPNPTKSNQPKPNWIKRNETLRNQAVHDFRI